MTDIFISYASEDRPRAEVLAQTLEGHGWSTFWDRTIPIGKTWRETIGKEIDAARCIIVLWSKTSIQSGWVQEEADDGKRRGILIPILIDEVQPPMGFRSIQAADLVDWNPTEPTLAFRRLIADIMALIGAPPKEAGEVERPKKEEVAKALEPEHQAELQAKTSAGLLPEQIAKAEELANWDFIKESQSPQDFREHLARFPKGVTDRMARVKLEAIMWQGLGSTPQLNALEGFLAEFPDGKHVSQAKALRDRLKTEADAALAEEKRKKRETEAWAAASSADTQEAYELFLRDWPGSQHAKAARSRIKTLGAAIPTARHTKRGKWLAGMFAVLVLPFQVAIGMLFHIIEWNWVGAAKPPDLGDLATGLLVALVIVVSLAAALGHWQRATLSGAEIGCYWLGCTLATLVALGFSVSVKEWDWTGARIAADGGIATGFFVALAVALGSAWLLVHWQRATLSGAEIGLYWLGCTLATFLALGSLFGVKEWNWVASVDSGPAGFATGSLVALVIALSSGALLVSWWRAKKKTAASRPTGES